VPKKIDDILHPKPPEDPKQTFKRTLRPLVLERLRVAKDAGEALSVYDLTDLKPLPKVGEGQLLLRAVMHPFIASVLEDLVEEGTVVRGEADSMPHFWLAADAAPSEGSSPALLPGSGE
jgi:hypothetical protein